MIVPLSVLQDRGLQSGVYGWPKLVSPRWWFFLIFCSDISATFHVCLVIQNSALVTLAVCTKTGCQFIVASCVAGTSSFQSGCSRGRCLACIYRWSLTCFQILKIGNQDFTCDLIRASLCVCGSRWIDGGLLINAAVTTLLVLLHPVHGNHALVLDWICR